MGLSEAQFNVMVERNGQLKFINVFKHPNVAWWVAKWRTSKAFRDSYRQHDPFFCCFCDFWSRAEFELVVQGFLSNDEGHKMDVYEMFLKPNKIAIWQIIESISVNSCREYLREFRAQNKK